MEKDNTPFIILALGAVLVASNLVDSLTDDGHEGSEDAGDNYVGDELDQEPTLTRQRMAQLADIIEQALLGNAWTENEAVAANAILNCNNDADIVGLISVFGRRSEPFWNDPFAQSYNLPQAVVRYFAPIDVYWLNRRLNDKGITYTF